MKPTVNVVWFKRDLRLRDHAPLAEATGALETVCREFAIDTLFSHEEIGLANTHARDREASRKSCSRLSSRILAMHLRPDRGGSRRGA